MKRITLAVSSIAAAVTLVVGGCAGNSSSGSDDSSDPITLMVIESMTGLAGVDQTIPKGAEAAASSINDTGGVKGRKIVIESCDTASDPNKAAECARKAVSDKVDAVVSLFDPIGVTGVLPILEAAKVPSIGPVGIAPPEYSSPISFPFNAGAPGGNFGMTAIAKDTGCKTVGTVGDTNADFGTSQALVSEMQKAGLDAYLVDVPTNTADLTPVVSQVLAKNPDCFAYAASGQVAVQLFAALRRAGSTAKLITASGSLVQPFVTALGPVAEGILGTQTTTTAGDDLKPFRDDLAKYQPSVTVPTEFTLSGWYAVQAIKQVGDGLDSVSAQSLTDGFNKTTDLKLPSLPTLDFTKTIDSKLYPRMFNPNVLFAQVKGGKWETTSPEWHSITEFLP